MGSITYYVDGMPVTVSDRTYSLNDTFAAVDQSAYKTWGDGDGSTYQLWRHQPSLRMVTTFLAENIAQVPLHAFERLANDDRQRLDRNHPLSRALRLPDAPRLTAYEMMRTLVLDVCLEDRYASQVFIDANGNAQVVRIPPSLWKFDRDSTGRPKSIIGLRKDGSEFTVGLDRALWLDGFPTEHNTSPIVALRGILAEADMAASYRRQLWANGGRMSQWVSRPQGVEWKSKDDRDKWVAAFREYAGSGDKAGRTPLLEDGMELHESGGITPEKGEHLEARKLSIAEVANAYHIPPQMVGQDSGSSYNSVSGYREMLYADTLGTWFQRLSDAFNTRLVPQLADPDLVYVEFNVAEKMRMTFEDQAKVFQTLTGGPVMTRAEVRKRLNLPHIDGTDDLIVPMNVTQGGQASPTDSGSQNIGGN